MMSNQKQLPIEKRCHWDGNDLMQHLARGNGKDRQYCDLSCGRKAYVIIRTLENLESRIPSGKPYLDSYVKFALKRIEDGYPIMYVREQLKKVRYEKSVFIDMIPKEEKQNIFNPTLTSEII